MGQTYSKMEDQKWGPGFMGVGKGARGTMPSTGFSYILAKTSQISKVL